MMLAMRSGESYSNRLTQRARPSVGSCARTGLTPPSSESTTSKAPPSKAPPSKAPRSEAAHREANRSDAAIARHAVAGRRHDGDG